MDIQTKIDLSMTADYKDWGYYKSMEAVRTLEEMLEEKNETGDD